MTNRKILLRWCIWFFTGNCVLFWLVGLNYLPTIPWLNSTYLVPKWQYELDFFIVVSYFGHFALLACLPIILVLPWVILNCRRCVVVFSIMLASAVIAYLLADSVIYNSYRFHLNGVVFHLVIDSLNKSFFDLSHYEFMLMALIALVIIIIESVYAWALWRWVIEKNRWMGMGKWVAIVLGLSLYLSYSMIIFSSGQIFHRVLVETTRFLPLYAEMFRLFLPTNNLSVAISRVGESNVEHSIHNYSLLNYPTEPMAFHATTKKLNLVIIVIDAWRFDMLNAANTPFLDQFSKQSWRFLHHYSGGNATGPGIFSLFYGLPAAYWPAMETHQRGPVLIDALLKQRYKTGIFFSGSLRLPAFNKTVFARWKDSLEDFSGNPYDRDVLMTQKFKKFINEQVKAKQPFFSYIHFDSAHGYCSLENNFLPFQPAIKDCNRTSLNNKTDPLPYFNRYKNALYLVDQQVAAVLGALRSNHLLNKTVIIITGDHGEEFNDNHQGYWNHASNFTPYQVRTPLIVYWPNKQPHVFHHMTTHYDIAPTLMKRMLGSTTPFPAYSVGDDLLDQKSIHPYLLVSSYVDLGILEKDRITRIFPTGDFQIERLNSVRIPSAKLHLPIVQQAFWQMRRFYKERASSF